MYRILKYGHRNLSSGLGQYSKVYKVRVRVRSRCPYFRILYAPLEKSFVQIMSGYNKLKNTAKKFLASISYNDNNSSQGLLPPNLRIILVPQSWPQGLDKEACQKLDKEEQTLWEDTLRKIFLNRQNFLRSCLSDYNQQIAKYSGPD